MKTNEVRILIFAIACGVMAAGCAVVRGHRGGPAKEVVVTEAPPGEQAEVVGAPPGRAYVWIGGHWAWHDHWDWERGHWTIRPRPDAMWVPGHWDKRPRGWVWTPGYWR
jgi:WXXGXW repeat (2 copies)